MKSSQTYIRVNKFLVPLKGKKILRQQNHKGKQVLKNRNIEESENSKLMGKF